MDREKTNEAAARFAQRGQFDRALAEYRKLLAQAPGDARTLQKVAELYDRMGEAPDAAEHFFLAGVALQREGFANRAGSLLKQALAKDPSRADAALRLADLEREQGLAREALGHLEQAGALYGKAGDAESLLGVIQRMAELEPKRAVHRVRLAELHDREGRSAEAADHLRQALELLREQGRADDWSKVAERLLELAPDDRELLLELARRDLARLEPPRAIARLQRLLGASPGDLQARELLARAYLEAGQTGPSVKAYKELAHALEERGLTGQSRAVWAKVRGLEPADREAARRNAHASREVSRAEPPPLPKAAPRAGTTGIERVSKVLAEVDVCLKFGLVEQADAHLRALLEAEPRHPGANERAYRLALAQGAPPGQVEDKLVRAVRLCAAAGERERAQALLGELAERNPRHPEARALREELGLAAPARPPPPAKAPAKRERTAAKAPPPVEELPPIAEELIADDLFGDDPFAAVGPGSAPDPIGDPTEVMQTDALDGIELPAPPAPPKPKVRPRARTAERPAAKRGGRAPGHAAEETLPQATQPLPRLEEQETGIRQRKGGAKERTGSAKVVVAGDRIACTLYGPERVMPGTIVSLRLWVAPPGNPGDFEGLVRCGELELGATVPQGTRLGFALSVPQARIDVGERHMIWLGDPAALEFRLRLAPGPGPTQSGTIALTSDQASAGRLRFTLSVRLKRGSMI